MVILEHEGCRESSRLLLELETVLVNSLGNDGAQPVVNEAHHGVTRLAEQA